MSSPVLTSTAPADLTGVRGHAQRYTFRRHDQHVDILASQPPPEKKECVKRIKTSPPPKNDSREKNLFEILHFWQDEKLHHEEVTHVDGAHEDKQKVKKLDPEDDSDNESVDLSQMKFHVPVPKCTTRNISLSKTLDEYPAELEFDAWNPPSDDWEYAERIIAEMEEKKLMHEDT